MAYVQGASNGGSAAVGSFTVTFSLGISSGNTIWGFVVTATAITSVTATIGGTSLNVLDSVTDSTNGEFSTDLILGNITGAPTVVTVNFNTTNVASDSYGAVFIEESGCAQVANPTDVHTGQLQTVSSTGANVITSGNVNTTVDGDIIVGMSLNDGGTTVQSAGTSPLSFQLRNQFLYGGALPMVTEDGAVLSPHGSVAATFGTTQTQTYTNFVIAIKPAPAVPYDPWPQLGPVTAQKRGSVGWTPFVERRRIRRPPPRRLLIPDSRLVLPYRGIVKRAA